MNISREARHPYENYAASNIINHKMVDFYN